MKNLPCIILLVFGSVVAVAQSAPSQTTEAWSDCWWPNGHGGTIVERYNKVRNETLVQLQPMSVKFRYPDYRAIQLQTGLGAETAMPKVSLASTYPGKIPTSISLITLSFTSDEPRPAYQLARGFFFEVEGEKFPLDGAVRRLPLPAQAYPVTDVEGLSLQISLEFLRKIANAKTVHVKLGETEFDFTENVLRAFRDSRAVFKGVLLASEARVAVCRPTGFSLVKPRCSLCLCGEEPDTTFTTETRRTPRTHRDTPTRLHSNLIAGRFRKRDRMLRAR